MLPIHDKVAAGGYAGLSMVIIQGVLTALGVTLAPPVVAAIVVIAMFAASYLKTETKIGAKFAPLADAVLTAIESEGPAKKG